MGGVKILGIVGSLRKDSCNRSALKAAQALVPDGTALASIELKGIPVFDRDDEMAMPRCACKNRSGEQKPDRVTICNPKEKIVEEEILSRRTMLRGALAVGCGLWIPVVFSGCDSRKGAPSGSAAPGSAPASSANPAAPAAAKKALQASVQYRTHPKGEQKCGQCQHFIAESNTCHLVEGQIAPEGWCSLWSKKA